MITPTKIDPRIHFVRDTPASRFFRRRLRDSKMMTFFNAETGQWILGCWLDEKRRWVEEFEDLGANCELLEGEAGEALTSMILTGYGGIDWGKHRKRILGKWRDWERKQLERAEESRDHWEYLKKKTADKCIMPFAFSGTM
jgi:hypothetical protein